MKGTWESDTVYAENRKNNACLEVDYEYDPGEDAVPYYPDGSGYPGSPPSITITGIYMNVDGKRSPDIENLLEELCGFNAFELAEEIMKGLEDG